ncbi:MAG: hypothetical protein ACREIV_08010, partial [Planctomycetaceae bacterium]
MTDSPPRLRLRWPQHHELNLLLAILAVVVLTAVFDARHNYVYRPGYNLVNITRETSLLGIFAIGAAIVIIAGGIDLSSGSVIAFSGTIFCTIILVLDAAAMQESGQVVAPWVLAVAAGGTLL